VSWGEVRVGIHPGPHHPKKSLANDEDVQETTSTWPSETPRGGFEITAKKSEMVLLCIRVRSRRGEGILARTRYREEEKTLTAIKRLPLCNSTLLTRTRYISMSGPALVIIMSDAYRGQKAPPRNS
jgi:hypothetical protein